MCPEFNGATESGEETDCEIDRYDQMNLVITRDKTMDRDEQNRTGLGDGGA